MIYLNNDKKVPIYQKIYDAILNDILNGTLSADAMLPPIRVLAAELHVSKNTVEHAYHQLVSEGLIRSVVGSGYYVEKMSNKFSNTENDSEIINENYNNQHYYKYDFRYSISDTSLFPWSTWKKCINNAIIDEASVRFSKYESVKGYLPLRQELCSFLKRYRGVVCSPEQIIICPGTQYALEDILDIVPKSFKKVAFEDPGFIGMRQIFINAKKEIIYVNIEEDGINIDTIIEKNPDIVYLNPSHQFPTGISLSLQKKYKLIEWAVENDKIIIENDYDSEFNYENNVLPAIFSLKNNQNVIYMGTLSKMMFSTIRCAYYILPKNLIKDFDNRFSHFNSSLPSFVQNAVYRFINDGSLERYMRKVANLNKIKYNLLSSYLKSQASDIINILTQPAGTHFLIKYKGCKDSKNLSQFMKSKSIGLHSITNYCMEHSKSRNIFIIGFSSIPEESIIKYAKILIDAFREFDEE